ncbi:hypothetical protein BB778_04105 [Pluralibacter gergoviae]|uniref:hypothetical protein n=1 Tax=Pluralibacter gergoviae TaxID=61647 RepID=UPI0008DC192A|nr:hypothetical protein [Pluralibacter gergoviae]OHY63817.1 hypothetical protein BB778_04105 [Pluralibacter gergoviae]
MTDITEMTQRLKAAAVRAKTATEELVAGRMSPWVCFSECDEFNRLTDGPDQILPLIEALEAKDARIAELEQEAKNWRTSFDNERFRADKLWNELQSRAEAAEQHAAELMSSLRPVGVMSQAAYYRLENSESRFIALWPRPEIYLPRKRPDDGVIVYARTSAGIQIQGGE